MARRPEHEAPADIYYNPQRARQYDRSTRNQHIQRKLTQRAIELMRLPEEPCLLLDVGCGSGLSGVVLDELGHTWIGTDISSDMLTICKEREFDVSRRLDDDGSGAESDPDAAAASSSASSDDDGPRLGHTQPFAEVIHSDMGEGLPLRPGCFDGAISISVIQWLCNIERKGQIPQKRLKLFFQSLYNCLRRGARAVLQFYPENTEQLNMISNAAMRCGFGGGVVVDYPHSARARKTFLVIYAGYAPDGYKPPAPLTGNPDDVAEEDDEEDDEEDEEGMEDDTRGDEPRQKIRVFKRGKVQGAKPRRKEMANGQARPAAGTREWVLMKKAERRRRGETTTDDSRYTHRKRRPTF